jgi:PAS domain-containing protein
VLRAAPTKRCNDQMADEHMTGERVRVLRAELTLKALPADLEPTERVRAVLEQVLVLTGAALAAVYAPRTAGDELGLVATSGLPRSLYELPESLPLSGQSPIAIPCRSGQPLWLTPDTAAPGPIPAGDFSLAVLPLPADDGTCGCLIAVRDGPAGFDEESRECLELFVAAIARPPGPDAEPDFPQSPPGTGGVRGGSFSLTLGTGRIEVDEGVLELFGLPTDFDGRVDRLLALTVPEDLPTLMSVVEPGHMGTGDRELEFRIRRPSGDLLWLRLRGRVLLGANGLPGRILGTVVDASRLRRGLDDVSRVQQLASALATATTVQDVSQVVVAALRRRLGPDRIAMAEIESDRMVVTVLDPPEPGAWPDLWRSEWRSEWPDAPIRVMPTLATALREARFSVWPAGTPMEPALAEVGPGGLAVLPLPAAGRIVGVCLVGWDNPYDFAADERALLTATAGLAGQALMRVRALDAEHELVGTLQRSLLPRRLPELPGGVAAARYLPATVGLNVGGDWYDVIPLPDNRVALVIGDVQGHNAGAAALMGQMRAAIRAYAVEGHPPDVVVSHANRLLVGMETDLFATCCYVEIDMEEGSGWCVRAGHLPPVLRHPDGSTEVPYEEGGPPLGVVTSADFPKTPLRLQPGTVLALYTDGLVESAELPFDEGLQRLRDAFVDVDPAHLDPVADALLAGAARHDDIALLLLRYDAMAIRPVRESWAVWRLPEAALHARRFTARTLRAWGLTEDTDTAKLIVSELVTNALVHTEGHVRLDLTLLGGRLRITVSDSSPRTPVKPTVVSWQATGGRGILLVEAMSADWGTVPVSGGKQVWSELELDRGGQL